MRVLFIDIDTLRPDHMGCYGYHRDTTPVIDTIASEGTLFRNYYCSDAPCLPSRAALISGMFGIRNGAVGHGGTAADQHLYGPERDFRNPNDEHNFHNIFRKAGMHTVSISTFPERHSSWWFSAGCNETYNVGKGGMESGEEVTPVALDWLNRRGAEDNWYLHLHLWDPHTPYRTPEGFGEPFADTPLGTFVTPEVFEKQVSATGPHTLRDFAMYDDREDPRFPKHPGKAVEYKDLRRIIDGYDNGILYADMQIGLVVEKLKALGIYEDTAIVVTSDHGENFGELSIYGEHATADQGTCRIPMIIKWPGCLKGREDSALHYSLDFLPTACDLLETDPWRHWDGQSYAETLMKGTEAGRESLVISQMAHVCQRSARFGDWLYIRTYHDGYHLFDKEMLFNLKDDPYEQHDVKDAHPDVCAMGAKIILDWHDEAMAHSNTLIDPLWRVLTEDGPYHGQASLLAPYLKRLEATGRASGAAALREKYGEDGHILKRWEKK